MDNKLIFLKLKNYTLKIKKLKLYKFKHNYSTYILFSIFKLLNFIKV